MGGKGVWAVGGHLLRPPLARFDATRDDVPD